jgi:uncharacterized alpha/beta hydrolase family protein
MGLTTGELSKIENEYIRNLQQQIYFLELEANYLYPSFDNLGHGMGCYGVIARYGDDMV